MDVIETVLWTFRNLADGCIAVFYVLLQVNELLGNIIIGVCVSATSWLRCLGKCLCYAYVELTYCCQDIAFFVCSIVNLTDVLVHGSADCVVKTFDALLHLAAFLKTSFANGCNGMASAACAVLSLCHCFLALLLDSAVLLLQMLPYTAFQVGRFALCGLSVTVKSIKTCVTVAVDFVVSAVVSVACGLSQFLFGQPVDVYTGLGILLLIAVIVKIAVRARAYQTMWILLSRLVNAMGIRRPQQRLQRNRRTEKPPSPPFTMTLRQRTTVHRDRLTRLKQELEEEREKQLCVVCLNQPRTVLLMPCRHFALCSQCIGVLFQQQHNICPMCRQVIYEAVPVYV